MEESALRALRQKLFAHSSDLLVEFRKHDAEESGKDKGREGSAHGKHRSAG